MEMVFTTWCYKLDPSQKAYSMFKVTIPISQRQARFILKKRLKIKKVFDIIACEEFGKGNFHA